MAYNDNNKIGSSSSSFATLRIWSLTKSGTFTLNEMYPLRHKPETHISSARQCEKMFFFRGSLVLKVDDVIFSLIVVVVVVVFYRISQSNRWLCSEAKHVEQEPFHFHKILYNLNSVRRAGKNLKRSTQIKAPLRTCEMQCSFLSPSG